MDTPCVEVECPRYSSGYGWVKSSTGLGWVTSYREAWFNKFGPIPDGNHIHHKCRNRKCVNTDHLELISAKEHMTLHGKQPKKKRPSISIEERNRRQVERYRDKAHAYKNTDEYELSSKKVSHFVTPIPQVVGDCIRWNGCYTYNGTPWTTIPGTVGGRSAHRDVWEKAHNASLLKTSVIYKSCRNRRCVNPDHLVAMSKFSVNYHTGTMFVQNAKKTHCKHGHPFTKETIAKTKHHGRFRICKVCGALEQRKSREDLRIIKGIIRWCIFIKLFYWVGDARKYIGCFTAPKGVSIHSKWDQYAEPCN